MLLKKPLAKIHTKTEVTESRQGVTQTLHENETDRVIQEPPQPVPQGKAIAMVRVVDSLKISQNYQSIGIEVGVEMPWPVRPGHVEDVQPAMRHVHELIETELAEKAADLRSFLKTLTQKLGTKTKTAWAGCSCRVATTPCSARTQAVFFLAAKGRRTAH